MILEDSAEFRTILLDSKKIAIVPSKTAPKSFEKQTQEINKFKKGFLFITTRLLRFYGSSRQPTKI